MPKINQYFILPIVVFVSGAVVMMLELAASRIIAPYLGSSVIVWTSLIGVMLASLALGNWAGGRIADYSPTPRTLAGLLLISSVFIALSSHFQTLLAPVAGSANLQVAAILAVCALFGPATIAMGTIAPLAVKLALTDVSQSGKTVGNLYALSNTGSIIGTFLGGFILISYLGSTNIIVMLSMLLALLVLLVLITARVWPSRWMWGALLLLFLAIMLPRGAIILSANERLLADVDTQYSRTWVTEQDIIGQNVRILTNSIKGYQSAMLVDDPDTLYFPYVRMLDTFQAFNPRAQNALVIGGSGYTYPRHFLSKDESRSVTVVEIDPGVTELARKYFGLVDDSRLTIVHEDGRVYLNRSKETHDLIIVDAFSSAVTIPFQLTTREAVGRISDSLADDGIVMVNILSALEGKGSFFLAAEYATYRDVFPYVKLYKVTGLSPKGLQNIMLVASRQPLVPQEDSPFTPELEQKEWRGELASLPILTDDFAPVERYASYLSL